MGGVPEMVNGEALELSIAEYYESAPTVDTTMRRLDVLTRPVGVARRRKIMEIQNTSPAELQWGRTTSTTPPASVPFRLAVGSSIKVLATEGVVFWGILAAGAGNVAAAEATYPA